MWIETENDGLINLSMVEQINITTGQEQHRILAFKPGGGSHWVVRTFDGFGDAMELLAQIRTDIEAGRSLVRNDVPPPASMAGMN